MKRSAILGAAIIVCVVIVAQLSLFPNALRLSVLETYHASGIAYDSSNHGGIRSVFADVHDPANSFQLNRSTGLLEGHSEVKDLHISMTLTARSEDGFPNVFQTAPGNDGVRLELSRGPLVLFAAAQTVPWRYFVISNSLVQDVAHHIDITIDTANRVLVIFDGQVAVDQTAPDLSYKLSDVVFGSGLSRTRPFIGSIDDAAVDIQIAKVRPNADALVGDLKVLCVTVGLICLYFLIGRERVTMLMPPWRRLPHSSLMTPETVEAALSANDDGVSWYVPLPRGIGAVLSLNHPNVPPSSLRYLASELEILGDSSSRVGTRLETWHEWILPDNSKARLRILDEKPFIVRKIYRLAQYVRDFADLLER